MVTASQQVLLSCLAIRTLLCSDLVSTFIISKHRHIHSSETNLMVAKCRVLIQFCAQFLICKGMGLAQKGVSARFIKDEGQSHANTQCRDKKYSAKRRPSSLCELLLVSNLSSQNNRALKQKTGEGYRSTILPRRDSIGSHAHDLSYKALSFAVGKARPSIPSFYLP